MIISRAPLRISLGGGGTDIPAHFKLDGGQWYSLAINKYVYTSINRRFSTKSLIRYSAVEELKSPSESKNVLLGAIFEKYKFSYPIEFTSHADVPSGTGLGSSGSFGVSALATIHTALNLVWTPEDIAKKACEVEIEDLKLPSGLQDQYISALGGLRRFDVTKSGVITSKELQLPNTINEFFNDHIVLIFTNISRDSQNILSNFSKHLEKKSSGLVDEKNVPPFDSYTEALIDEDHYKLGDLLEAYWNVKKLNSNRMSNDQIDVTYNFLKNNGMIGGKIVGAGGGGFILAVAKDMKKLLTACKSHGLRTMHVAPEYDGVKVVENMQNNINLF